APFTPDLTTQFDQGYTYKGVFLYQSGPPYWTPPYYSINAPSPQSLTINGQNFSSIFQNWTTSSASVSQPTSATTPVVFTSSGGSVTANYKGIHLSNDASAFTDNSVKKVVETTDGVLHQVYTSSMAGVSHVWYETSTNQGTTWSLMNNGQPLDGTNGGKCPSIAVDNTLINQDGYGVVIVFQQQGAQGGVSGSTFTLQLMNFFQHLSNYNTINMTQTLFSEPKDAYSTTNANPNIVWGDASGDFLATWERKNTYQTDTAGINYEYGQLSNNVYTIYGGSPNHVIGTDANSIHASISCNYGATPNSWGYDLAYHLAWEEYVNSTTSHINWCALIEFLNPISIWQYTPDLSLFDNITKQSSYVLNVRPSVIALTDTNAMVWWTGDIDGHGTYYNVNAVGTNPSTHSAFSFGGAAVRSVSANSAGNTSNYYVAYSMNYPSSNWYNRAALGSAFYNFVTLNTTGQDIQLSNGPSSSSMYVSSYSPFSLPYYFNTSQSLNAGGLSKENSNQEFYIRGISLKRGALGLSYFFEDLVVDGNSIDFVDAPDSTDYGILGNVNKVFVTKPFAINSNSNFSFTEYSGFADSTVAAQVLGTSGYAAYKVELVDNATNAVIGTIRNTTMKSSNAAASSVVPCILNTRGVGSRTVVVRITYTTNLDSVKTGLMKGYATVNPTAGLAKASLNELTLGELDVPTSYALDQNYPNPFNPSTTINYQIPKDGLVTLKIYDALGREVKTLLDEYKSTGKYSVQFDASHLASGVYFYSIHASDFVDVKKMMLIK
ncbi:MAG: T9SS type A sorting domain-containing protein, partial [Polyangia bacterium]